ncbi:hypothetical protein RHMOL_Rhmol09G0275700 [Rhododendron molle]|uniref:Uncharacterized protein n=1 Tax=Rhododendron molle TaxID=49168 RepID=A0ACC0MIB7_RHOML|nr:hypothetical protein RHMOL_Rhmol09G0275700 [Rhododendron molle]
MLLVCFVLCCVDGCTCGGRWLTQGVGMSILLGAGTQKTVEINFFPLLGGRALKYSVFGGIKVQSDLPFLVDKCINKEIEKIDELLTHEVQLEDVDKAFELLKKPDCLKVLINF